MQYVWKPTWRANTACLVQMCQVCLKIKHVSRDTRQPCFLWHYSQKRSYGISQGAHQVNKENVEDTRKGELFSYTKKNEMSFAGRWMELEINM
jgi:hypothetical protein